MTSLAPTPGLNRYAPRVPPATALTDETCALLQENVPVRRRIVREGDRVYQVRQQLESLHITRERNAMMALCSLPANERVADFLRMWLEELGERGLRTDQITLHMTRAEIGTYLGLTLESVSRAFSHLARENVIGFPEKGRRHVSISDADALARFVQRGLAN